MRILTMIPFCPRDEGQAVRPHGDTTLGFDFGYALNQCFERLDEDDWMFILDHDAMVTTLGWYRVLEDALERFPHIGALTCYLNKGPKRSIWQVLPGVDADNNDIRYHRMIGSIIEKENAGKYLDVTEWETLEGGHTMGGIFCLSRRTWEECGRFPEKQWKGLDFWLHRRLRDLGKRVYLLQSLYVYHWGLGRGYGPRGPLRDWSNHR